MTTWQEWWLPRNTAQPLKWTWKKLQEGHNEISIYSITEWKLCRYRWKRWTRSVATLLLHCSSMDRVERVQAPPNALGNAAEQRASTDCRTTRKLGLSNNAPAWIAREMRNGAGHKLCRELQTSAQAHEKCTKDETARKMCKAELCTLWRRAVQLFWWELVLLETSTCKVCLQKGFWTFPQIQYHRSLKMSFTLYTCTLN